MLGFCPSVTHTNLENLHELPSPQNCVHSFSKICFLTHIVLYVFSICTKIRVLWTRGAHFIWMEKHCFPWLSTAVLRTHFSPNGILHVPYPAALWKLSKPPAFLSQISLLHISFPFVPGLWISEAGLSHSPSIPHPSPISWFPFSTLPALSVPPTPSCFSSFFAPESSVLGWRCVQNNVTYLCPDNTGLYKPSCSTQIGTNCSLL